MPLAQLTLHGPMGDRTFWYRPDSLGDQGVIAHIVYGDVFNLDGFAQADSLLAFAGRVRSGDQHLLIIDGGANIGASAVYFAQHVPRSRVIAVEPERNNFDLLTRNCAGLDVVTVNGAIASRSGTLFLSDPGESDWGFRVSERGDVAVEAFSMRALMTAAGPDVAPYICKLDIEGGEAELFSRDVAWMDAFALLIIETHDWMLPGTSNSRTLWRAIAEHEFDVVPRGEHVFCFNNRVLHG